MKVGLIARGEDRGLGIMLWEFARHLQPERTLLVDMGELARGFRPHADRYPGATVAHFDGVSLPEDQVRAWLAGLDVVYSAETFYDWRLIDWAREAGVATVCHVMPEFYRHWSCPELADPDAWWAPTTWRLSSLPERTRLVPVPVALDRWPRDTSRAPGPLRVVHVAGHRAMGDRNGTTEVLMALARCSEPMEVTLLTQDPRLPSARALRGPVKVQTRLGGVTDYWRLYEDADVLLLPRRYGGLCLPAQEAMGAGLAVIMTDAEPQASFWPVITVPTRPRGTMTTGGGKIELVTAVPDRLALALDALAREPAVLADAQERGRAWASEHSWANLTPTYRAELARVADLARNPG